MSAREESLAGRAVELAAAALPGAEVGVEVAHHEMALTRFAESVIHQNVAEDVTTVPSSSTTTAAPPRARPASSTTADWPASSSASPPPPGSPPSTPPGRG